MLGSIRCRLERVYMFRQCFIAGIRNLYSIPCHLVFYNLQVISKDDQAQLGCPGSQLQDGKTWLDMNFVAGVPRAPTAPCPVPLLSFLSNASSKFHRRCVRDWSRVSLLSLSDEKSCGANTSDDPIQEFKRYSWLGSDRLVFSSICA